MASSSRKETYDSNTPSSLSSRNGLYRRFPKGVNTIQSDRGSISNSSVHTTSPATTSEDLFDYTEINPAYLGGVPSVYDPKSFHSLEKQTLRFRNQSQSTIRIIRDAGSVSSSTATFSSARSSNMIAPSLEDEDGSPDDILLEDSAPALPDPDETRAREARVLESKVARVASSSYSVEEVFALQKEVDHWLSEATAADTSTELPLSSLLLKTILANHFASKAADDREMRYKLQINRLERELHNQKAYYNEKVQECRSLRIELSRFVTTPTTPFVSSTSQSSPFFPSSSVESPTSFRSETASRLGFTRPGPQGVNSPLMSTPVNVGIGAGGRPRSPTDSSVHSDERLAYYPNKAKALYAYTASLDDPNEISFSKGENLDIIHGSGKWWQARNEDGAVGIVSKDLIQII